MRTEAKTVRYAKTFAGVLNSLLPSEVANEESGRPEEIILTRREKEIITHIARGRQNKTIAYEMNISINTVRAHIGNIMRKFKLKNRTQIAILAIMENVGKSSGKG